MIGKRRVLRALIMGVIITSYIATQGGVIAHATTTTSTAKMTEEEKKKAAEEAKKKDIERLQGIVIESNQIENWPQGPVTTGEAACLMDMTTGAVLYAKSMDTKLHPASITKILTACVALDNNALDKTITVTQENLNSMESGASSIGLKAGEQITEEQGLYATMLASANEAAYAVAESTTGSYDEFLKMMNERATSLGCKNSCFCNSNGLNDEAHVTSAKDMALIARAAYQNEEFRKIIATLQYTIPNTNMVQEPRVFQQHHKMILPADKNYYEYATGGKTGYTSIAGNTLVTYAEKDGMKLVAVVLKESYQSHYADTKSLFEYGFANFSHMNIDDNEHSDKFENVVNEGACVTVPQGVSFSDLTETVEATGTKEDGLGCVTYSYKDQLLGKAKVQLSASYLSELYPDEDTEVVATTNTDGVKTVSIPKWYYAVFAVWFILIIGCIVIRLKMNKKHR